jgi:hypothetical protein
MTVISREHYQSRAKKIWQNILERELCHCDTAKLEMQLVRLERKIALFRTWKYQ